MKPLLIIAGVAVGWYVPFQTGSKQVQAALLTCTPLPGDSQANLNPGSYPCPAAQAVKAKWAWLPGSSLFGTESSGL